MGQRLATYDNGEHNGGVSSISVYSDYVGISQTHDVMGTKTYIWKPEELAGFGIVPIQNPPPYSRKTHTLVLVRNDDLVFEMSGEHAPLQQLLQALQTIRADLPPGVRWVEGGLLLPGSEQVRRPSHTGTGQWGSGW